MNESYVKEKRRNLKWAKIKGYLKIIVLYIIIELLQYGLIASVGILANKSVSFEKVNYVANHIPFIIIVKTGIKAVIICELFMIIKTLFSKKENLYNL